MLTISLLAACFPATEPAPPPREARPVVRFVELDGATLTSTKGDFAFKPVPTKDGGRIRVEGDGWTLEVKRLVFKFAGRTHTLIANDDGKTCNASVVSDEPPPPDGRP